MCHFCSRHFLVAVFIRISCDIEFTHLPWKRERAFPFVVHIVRILIFKKSPIIFQCSLLPSSDLSDVHHNNESLYDESLALESAQTSESDVITLLDEISSLFISSSTQKKSSAFHHIPLSLQPTREWRDDARRCEEHREAVKC